MDNAQKAIMIGVGLFITIIVIAAVMLITGMGQDLLNSGTEQLGNISAQLESQLTQEFDEKTMTGAQVLSAVKKYYNQTDMAIVVENGDNSDQIFQAGGLAWEKSNVVNYSNSISITPLSYFSDKSKVNFEYIVTTSKYTSKLLKVNDAVVGISFTKIK